MWELRLRVIIILLVVGIPACSTDQTGVREEKDSGDPPEEVMPAPPLLGILPNGKEFDLESRRGKWLVLVFYRSASCGLCIQQLEHLERDKEAYDHLGVEVLAVTADPPATNEWVTEEYDLGFPIISVDRETLAEWGVWQPDERRPRPAAFIIDERGEILYHQIGETAADRASDATLVFAIRALEASSKGR